MQHRVRVRHGAKCSQNAKRTRLPGRVNKPPLPIDTRNGDVADLKCRGETHDAFKIYLNYAPNNVCASTNKEILIFQRIRKNVVQNLQKNDNVNQFVAIRRGTNATPEICRFFLEEEYYLHRFYLSVVISTY